MSPCGTFSSRTTVSRPTKLADSASAPTPTHSQTMKDGWELEADKIACTEKHQAAIVAALNRRVFIRAWCVASCQV